MLILRMAASLAALAVSTMTVAQTPGEWRYVIATDMKNIPADMRVNFPTIAGRAYELRALADGHKPGFATVSVEEWRDPRGDPREPIDVAKKKESIEKHIDLEVDPEAAKPAPKGK